jgi:hypothetical protein
MKQGICDSFFLFSFIIIFKISQKNSPKQNQRRIRRKQQKYRQLCLGKLPIMMEVNKIFHVNSFV